jgi:DNA-binding XRE family transcriptional regulator
MADGGVLMHRGIIFDTAIHTVTPPSDRAAPIRVHPEPNVMPDPVLPWADDDALPDPLHRLTRQMIAARVRANLTQADVAWRMKSSRTQVSRLECGRGRGPSFATLAKYAEAVGCDLDVRLAPVPFPWERFSPAR